ncbi:MAG: hypothetical protein WC807_09595 [Hyphomicrobium sp.]
MSTETLSKTLVKAADAAGYAMASREEDLTELEHVQPEAALRNGHASAARTVRRISVPFARLADLIEHLFALSDFSRTHSTRALLTGR